jgi:putative thioredoxin
MSGIDKQPSPFVTATTPESFDTDVFERSHETTVVLDFWAEWCAPCRMLGPVLEKLAEAYEGRFVLVKANTDEVSEAAARFQVQGIPAVFAVCDGEVVDAFQGALPEAEIRLWLDRVLTGSILAEARRLEETAPAAAEAKYRGILVETPNHAEAQIGLARTLLAHEHIEECRSLIAKLEERGFLEPEAEKIKSALELSGKEGGDLAGHRAAVEADPENLALQFALAESLAGAGEYEEALETSLAIVQQDRAGVGEQARQLMIDVFRVLPEDSELTSSYRRKLSMALY